MATLENVRISLLSLGAAMPWVLRMFAHSLSEIQQLIKVQSNPILWVEDEEEETGHYSSVFSSVPTGSHFQIANASGSK